MFIDTHCHLNMIAKKEFDKVLTSDDLKKIFSVVDNAKKNNVTKIITIGTSLIESQNSILIAKEFFNVFAAIGIHPCDCSLDWKSDFIEIKKYLKQKEDNKIVGIGETGLDFFHRPFDKQRQIDAFKSHIELALTYDVPIIVHVRDSSQEVLAVLEEYKNEVKGVIHCFLHKKDFADIVLDWGFYIGLNAPTGYPKNQWFRDLIPGFDINKILLETDAPFLPPQELRGKQNLPEYIPLFAKIIADLIGIKVEEFGRITSANAERLFGI